MYRILSKSVRKFLTVIRPIFTKLGALLDKFVWWAPLWNFFENPRYYLAADAMPWGDVQRYGRTDRIGLHITGSFIGAFAKLCTVTVSFVIPECLSVHPSFRLSVWNNSAPTRRIFMKFCFSIFMKFFYLSIFMKFYILVFSWNFIFQYFSEICPEKSSLITT
jgi:hypothetical protein